MAVTAFGYVFLPLCLLAMFQPIWLLQLVMVAGIFGAATPLVIGSLGLPPAVPPAALFLGFVVLQYLLGARYPAENFAWRTLEPFMLVAAYALVTSLLLPRLFEGSFTVWPQKLAPPFDIPVPLAPGMSNVTQSFYLLIDGAMLVAGALFLTRNKVDFARLLNTYLWCGVAVVGICGWQLAHKLTGLYFPEFFFYSNPGWVIFPGQTMGIVPRINGPFSEPAALAFYLSGTIFSCAWIVLRGHRNRLATFLLPFAILALLFSTSTTGFAVLAVGAAWLVIYGIFRAPRRVAARIFAFAIPIAVLCIVGGLAIASLSDKFQQSIALVLNQSLNKAEGESFANRTGLDLDSISILIPSYGLGAGWGSVRASSLIPGLLANLGVFGCGLLVWFAVRLRAQMVRARPQVLCRYKLMVLDGLSAAVVGSLAAAAVSAPALNGVDFYLTLGALVACAARIEFDAAVRRAQARRVALAVRQRRQAAEQATRPNGDIALGGAIEGAAGG